MIYPPLAPITYMDGTTFELPQIQQSSNGWTYKPDAMRTEWEIQRGKNKVWPRTEGHHEAKEWYWKQIEAHFAKNKDVPLLIEGKVKAPNSQSGDSLNVCWNTKLWGWISISLQVDQRDSLLTYTIVVPDVAKILLAGVTSHNTSQYDHRSYISYEVGATHISDRVKAFIEDPWESIKQFAESLEWDRVLGTPPEAVRGQDYKKDHENYNAHDRHDSTPTGEVRSTSSGNGLFYRKGVVEKITRNHHNWEALNELLSALQFTGFTIKPRFTYNYLDRNNEILSGVTIDIPPQDGMEAHSVSIEATNPHVTVTCGFQQDEDKWIDRKKRQADEQLAEMTRDLAAIKYEIEL